ncbi:MAG: hypothetical protein VYE40_07955 [Myxococcota bacterium]|nr:hypothetical protein [Myxococcota bacterium]MEC9441016.1 hypothetical protein [Myxococcota bacterium]
MLDNSQIGQRIREQVQQLQELLNRGAQNDTSAQLEDLRNALAAIDHLCAAAQANIKWSDNADGNFT